MQVEPHIGQNPSKSLYNPIVKESFLEGLSYLPDFWESALAVGGLAIADCSVYVKISGDLRGLRKLKVSQTSRHLQL